MNTEILVTGGSGQLATAMRDLGGAWVRVVGRPDFDFDTPATIDALFASPPKILVNAAAWTAVDLAETEPEAADRANHLGPADIAGLCARHGTRLIHVSTDYVFDGNKGAPYLEDDATNPTGVYGATKLAGEKAVMAACPTAIILRTSWVYAAQGKNFFLTMLNAAKRLPKLRVVADQRGTPSYAPDLAAAILAIIDKGMSVSGIFHVTGSGETSWHGFATAIFAEAAKYGYPVPEVEAIATADWPTPAKRPGDSRLDCGKLAHHYGVILPAWQDSLVDAVRLVCAADR
jgi:dTDP-4-dehydrorhamnose reductase